MWALDIDAVRRAGRTKPVETKYSNKVIRYPSQAKSIQVAAESARRLIFVNNNNQLKRVGSAGPGCGRGYN